MLRVRPFLLPALICAIVAGSWSAAPRPARADDPTATTAPTLSAEPTAIPSSTTAPSPLPTAIVRPEHTPVVVVTQPVVTLPTASPTAGAPLAPPTGSGDTLLPSPAQLRESALMRWGGRVPAAVHRWAFLIVPAARRYGLDPNLIAAVMTMESGGDPRAWNTGSDARGLMQVLHGPWDPAQNIDEGARMLSDFLDEFHDLRLALAAYNAGPGAVIQYDGIPPYRETHDYVIIVTYLYDLYAHRHLSSSRRLLYRQTVSDLRHFKDQRKKVAALAKVGAVVIEPMTCRQDAALCGSRQAPGLFPTMDPFWPLPGLPDPLQHIGPAVTSS